MLLDADTALLSGSPVLCILNGKRDYSEVRAGFDRH